MVSEYSDVQMDLSKQSLVACSALVLDLNDLVFFKGNQELNSYSPKFPTTFVYIQGLGSDTQISILIKKYITEVY